MDNYGVELILDIHECNVEQFTRSKIEQYLIKLCHLIDMNRADLHWWDYEGQPWAYDDAPDHLKGVSCIQFITTSDIRIHTLDVFAKIFINIFTCKDFNVKDAESFSIKYFGGVIKCRHLLKRL